MSGIQGSPFRVILLAATMVALLATSLFSADIKTLHKQAEAGDAESQFNISGEVVPEGGRAGKCPIQIQPRVHVYHWLGCPERLIYYDLWFF